MYHGNQRYGPVPANYTEVAHFDNETQTYDVTNMATGMFPSYLALIAKGLNFTYTLLQRKDRVLGSVDDNGNPTGMIASLHHGDAEMIAYCLGFNSLRR